MTTFMQLLACVSSILFSVLAGIKVMMWLSQLDDWYIDKKGKQSFWLLCLFLVIGVCTAFAPAYIIYYYVEVGNL
jgi:ABC-type multidrug transport system fused ATPase/permease subunit